MTAASSSADDVGNEGRCIRNFEMPRAASLPTSSATSVSFCSVISQLVEVR